MKSAPYTFGVSRLRGGHLGLFARLRVLSLRDLALPALIGVFVASTCFFAGFTLDDAFITFQYARNVADGNGLAFNPGEVVEGYSNFLWVILLATVRLLGGDLVHGSKIFGILFGAGSLFLIKKLADHLMDATRLRYVPVALTATSAGILYYSASGLETALYTFLLTSGIYFRISGESRHSDILSLIAFLLASLTRPEGILFLLLKAGDTVMAHGVPDYRRRCTAAAVALGCYAAFLLWRFNTFGDWLPNTYYAKPGVAFSVAGLSAGFSYIHGFIGENGTYLTTALFLFAVPANRFAALCVGGLLFFAAYTGGDWMTHHRLLLPALPLIYLLAAIGLENLISRFRLGAHPLVVSAVLVLLGSNVYATVSLHKKLSRNIEVDHAHISRANAELGRWLAAHADDGDAVVTDEIGAIGYYSGLRILDPLGLIDTHVARILNDTGYNPYGFVQNNTVRREAQRRIADYLLKQNPRFVLIDYAGPLMNGTYDERFVNPFTMQSLYEGIRDRYSYVQAFTFSHNPMKAFLVFELAQSSGR